MSSLPESKSRSPDPQDLSPRGIVRLPIGNLVQTLIERLNERLAFERSGARLYAAMLVKCRANGVEAQGYLGRLEEIAAQEAAHVTLLIECIESFGGDPIVLNPAVDVTGVEGAGLMQALADPTTSVMQSLRAILFAELIDKDAWAELIDLAEGLRRGDLVQQFQAARDQERSHLNSVRRWHRQATHGGLAPAEQERTMPACGFRESLR